MTQSGGKVMVKPVERSCTGCAFIGRGHICSLCASLVVDSEGGRWVYLRGIEDGADGFTVDASELTPAPKLLC